MLCQRQPKCPSADAKDREVAQVLSGNDEQGWSLPCNGLIPWDDGGGLLPDGRSVISPAGPALIMITS